MGEQILRYTVILGDWSDDGHGKTDHHQIEFFAGLDAAKLTEELIVANYNANVKKLGFGLPQLWDEYEKSSPSEDQIFSLRDELGAMIYLNEDEESIEESGLSGEFYAGEELSTGPLPFGGLYAFRDYRGKISLDMDEPLDLAMFMILAGLPEVSWRELKSAPRLFGGSGTPLVGNKAVGYGLYF